MSCRLATNQRANVVTIGRRFAIDIKLVVLGGIAIVSLFAMVSRVNAQEVPELVIRPAVLRIFDDRPLTDKEKKQVKSAVEAGVTYLRRTQPASGSWLVGQKDVFVRYFPAAFAALPGLALLESGVPPSDPTIQIAARVVRARAPAMQKTYSLSLSILFLDKLGEARDRQLIRHFGLRIAGAQSELGGWSYNCPQLTDKQQQRLLAALRQWSPKKGLPQMRPSSYETNSYGGQRKQIPKDTADNSNSQFALLALWVARKYDLPLGYTFARAEQRFRTSQLSAGWGYNWRTSTRTWGTMTCVGILALAVGRGSLAEHLDATNQLIPRNNEDKGIASGLRALAGFTNDPTDKKAPRGPRGLLNLYFLWSVERTAMFCNLETIGARDWYRWGADLLLRTQRPDGSWLGRGNNVGPVIDTSMALLFLSKSDLLPDLRKTLQKHMKITDPVLDDLKKLIAKKNGGKLPKAIAKPGDENLSLKLGILKANQPSTRKVRVRSFAPFRIMAIRGNDKYLGVDLDNSDLHKVHELTLTVRPDKPGDFERTIYLKTDIPGRAEVPVRIEAKVVAK